jgi:hypothetical protein
MTIDANQNQKHQTGDYFATTETHAGGGLPTATASVKATDDVVMPKTKHDHV